MSAAATRLEVHPREASGKTSGGAPVAVYTVAPPLADPDAALSRLADPVLHRGIARGPGGCASARGLLDGATHAVEVGFLPGVTDNEGSAAEEMLLAAGLVNADARVFSSRVWLLGEGVDAHGFAAAHHNPLIQHARVLGADDYARGAFPTVLPEVRLDGAGVAIAVTLPDDRTRWPRSPRAASWDRTAWRAGRSACRWTTSRPSARTTRRSGATPPTSRSRRSPSPGPSTASTASSPPASSATSNAPTVCSGRSWPMRPRPSPRAPTARASACPCSTTMRAAIAFDDEWMVCDKVETHNSPSALDPYGGAMTGIVGVNRDALGFGLGARPIANRYGFCFGHPGDERPLYRDPARRSPLPSVDAIIEGVARGVEDGGNQSGIPTVQGFVVHDDSYRGKPLVFCGTLGLMPRRLPDGREGHVKRARPGDAILMVGGRVGRDGVHGATFSSLALDEASPATAVQIGDPITQKRMSDAVLTEARDAGLYTSITDNGAGGLSSSVGEMARESGGAELWLDRVPLKYPGLEPWEIWISESQERMTLAVPPEHVAATIAVFARHGVEASEIGRFTDDGAVGLRWQGEEVGRLDLAFLHEGAPRLELTARRPARVASAGLPPMPPLDDVIPRLLAASATGLHTALSRRYDHEVQGTSLVKPLQGAGAMPGDATAIAPVPGSRRAVGLTQALLPHLTEIDPHACAVLSVDLAVRRLIALGCDPDRIALLDNICWSSPEEPGRVWQLHETMRGAHAAAVHFGAPFISGKDSMYNDFRGFGADGEPLHVAALPTLLVSALGILRDRDHAQTLDLKCAGDVVAMMGPVETGLGGSAYARLHGLGPLDAPSAALPPVDAYAGLADALGEGRIASALAIGPGGLGVALARSCLAGRLGARIDASALLNARQGGPSPRADQALFGEGAGQMLLSLSPEAFDEIGAGLGLVRLGTVTGEGTLSIVIGDRRVAHDLADLERACGREASS